MPKPPQPKPKKDLSAPDPRHPMQSLVMTDKVVRFRANEIVRQLLDRDQARHKDDAGFASGGLNWIAAQRFSQADLEQFYQLIGYSLAGFHELSNVSDATALEASEKARKKFGNKKIGGCRDRDPNTGKVCEMHAGVERS